VEREEEEVLLMILEGSGESIYLTRIPETLFLSLSLFCSVVFNNNNETHSLAIFILVNISSSILERERE
jgi:pantothenate kinase